MSQDTPNIIIPIEHQSAPQEHWIEKIMRKAVEEIESGQFKPPQGDDYFYTGPEQTLALHPRVQEALERLEKETQDAPNSQEAIEKAQMYHEMAERAAAPEKWNGQGRWIGAENEEMRMGEVMEPREFMRRLTAVIGNRVELNRFAVQGRVALLVHDPEQGELRRLAIAPRTDYNAQIRAVEEITSPQQLKARMRQLEQKFAAAEKAEYAEPDYLKDKAQVATLQWPLSTEWMVMRFNEFGVPTAAKYLGWRTALLSMMSLRIITEQEAHKAFPVQASPASVWYRAQLYHMRNGVQA